MKKLLSILSVISLSATTSGLAVACLDASPIPNLGKEIMDDNIDKVVNKGFATPEAALEAVKESIKADPENGLFVIENGVIPKPTDIDQTLFRSVDLNAQKTKVVVTYSESINESGNLSNIIWGPEQSYDRTIKITRPVIQEIANQTLIIGQEKTIDVKVTNPIDGVELQVVVSNNNFISASLKDNKLTIKAIGVGSSAVTLKYENAEDFTFIVTVNEKPKPVITKPSDQTLTVGESKSVDVSIANQDNGTLTAESDKTNVIEVKVEGSKVSLTAKAAGEATITLSYTGAENVSFKVTVNEKPKPVITKPNDQTLTVGDNKFVDITITNQDNGTLTASSDKENVVQVSVDGTKLLLNAKSSGTAVITLSYPGATNVTFNVTVNDKPVEKPVIAIPSDQTLTVGDEEKVIAIEIENPTSEGELKASSSSNDIATVSVDKETNKVSIHAVGKGEATITLSYPDADNVTFKVTVKEEEKPVEKPVITSPDDQTLTVGDDDKTITVAIANATTDGKLSASSSDEEIATVSVTDSKITISAKAAGTATITLTYPDADNVTFKVTVKEEEIPVEKPVITSPDDQTLTVGDDDKTITVAVANATTDGKLSASSSDEEIATVSVTDSKITISAKAAGTATITLSYPDADNVTFKVTVKEEEKPVEKPVITSPDDQTLTVGDDDKTITVAIANATTDGKLSASSSDKEIATVSVTDSKITISAKAAGTATITLSYPDADNVTFKVTVKEEEKPVEKPVITSPDDQTLTVGDDDKTITVAIANATTDGKLSASSSDEEIATVSVTDSKITISAKAAGETTITLSYPGADEVTFKVTVKEKEPEIIKLEVNDIINNEDVKKIQNLSDLNAVNEALGKIKITGVSSLKASTINDTDVKVEISLEENYSIDETNFTITSAIAKKDVELDMNDIKDDSQFEAISNLKDLAEVNEKLKDISIEGVKSITASAIKNNDTDVLITIELESGYTLGSQENTFTIINAIAKKDVELDMNDIKSDSQFKVISNLKDLAEVNEKLKDISIEGVKSITASAIKNNDTDVLITIELESGYTLGSQENTFTITNAIEKEVVKTEIKVTSISENEDILNIKDKASLQEVNDALAELVKNFEGVTKLEATLKEGSETDVVITITIDDQNYTIDNATFDLNGAIKTAE
ncbi:hypothetical protein SCHIN_v1c07150 [Spiroplasma chinense]|uniref:BIG2 domain-containing protein n=1 Tax=Spiroplasma chinense TaxID=216932 RepID=A0A5B9Y4M6_9MOLU|nr:Ig-like domain-containing protein [Spiroplasma chinense]QEH61910.1 hypothetical protein SCHIN_v1c07150 [Spiroplasma chinense]